MELRLHRDGLRSILSFCISRALAEWFTTTDQSLNVNVRAIAELRVRERAFA